jgi:hypothetical protein
MKATILFVAIVFVFSGCVHHNLQNYAAIDLSQKTVTVPPGAKGLRGKLKQVLAEEGWRLSIDRGPSVVEGDLGSKTKLESYDTFNTRYRLRMASRQFDVCVYNFTPAYIYDISFIDNKTGSEVFTIEGKGCEGGVVDKFREAISGVSK